MLLDLARPDQIDNVARVMGSTYVDEMVGEAARALRSALPDGRTAYHLAATQFAFVAPPGVDDQAYIAQLAGLLAQYRAVSMVRFVTTVAIGVAPFVLGRARPADVLRQAHGAAQDARGSDILVGFHSRENEGVHRRRFDLLQDFGAALASPDQLRLV